MEQTEEAHPEPEAERSRGLRLVDEGGVVETQLVEGLAQPFEVVALRREQAGEHHRLGLGVAGERVGGAPVGPGHGVADANPVDLLDAGDQIADLARTEGGHGNGLRGEHADLVGGILLGGCHEADRVAPAEAAVDHAQIADDAPVGVVVGVEDQRPQRRAGIAPGCREARDDGFQ